MHYHQKMTSNYIDTNKLEEHYTKYRQLQKEKVYDARTSAVQNSRQTALLRGTMLATSFIIFIFLLSYGFRPNEKTHASFQAGSTFFANISNTPFVDDNALELLHTLLINLTDSCTPPPGDPSLLNAVVGNRQNVNDAWVLIREQVKLSPANLTNGCYFYGLLAAESRAGGTIGPVDICHAYVHIGIDVFHAVYQFEMPIDIVTILNDLYDIAYPLNIFWTNTNDPVTMKTQVVSMAYQVLLCMTTPLSLCSNGIDVKALSRQFCNGFFASEDINYYKSAYMPWLAFPFPGLMQRSGENYFTPESENVLELDDIFDALNTTLANFFPIKSIFVVGDVLTQTPGMQLLLQSLFVDIPQFLPPPNSPLTVSETLAIIHNNVQALAADETILIVGRYTEDADAYNSATFVRDVKPVPALFLLSNVQLATDDFVVTSTNGGKINLEILNYAASRQVMNVADFVTTLGAYDAFYVREDYVLEKFVALYLVYSINNILGIDMNETTQLLDTFSLKNVLINGVDIGGQIDSLLQKKSLESQGNAFGFLQLPGTVNENIDVLATNVFGGGEPDYPSAFDYRIAKPNCMVRELSQGKCNSCWAISVSNAAKARFCIQGITQKFADISTASVISCSGQPSTDGCIASHPSVALSFLALHGAVDNVCFKTKTSTCAGDLCKEQSCVVGCTTDYSVFKNFNTNPAYYALSGENAFKSELFNNGPFASCFMVPADFESFFNSNPTGCYSNDAAPIKYGHCVTAIGYDEGNMYFRNSWGTGFANNGDFCVKLGMKRAKTGPWFTNAAWAARPATVKQVSKTVTVPAGGGRDVTIITDANTLQGPQTLPQQTKRPRPSSGEATQISHLFVVMCVVLTTLITACVS